MSHNVDKIIKGNLIWKLTINRIAEITKAPNEFSDYAVLTTTTPYLIPTSCSPRPQRGRTSPSFKQHSPLVVAGRAFTVLERAADKLSEHIPEDKRPPKQMVSAHIWAMSHGVVELFARGSPGTKSPFPPEDLLESGIGVYLRGLGLIPPDS